MGDKRSMPRFVVKAGKGKKTGKPYYSVSFTLGDFTSDPIFVDKIHYDYLKAQIGDAAHEDFKQGNDDDEPLDDLDD